MSDSQTRKPQRLATLLLLGALACYALWLIGLALRSSCYRIEFGSRKKAATALSVILSKSTNSRLLLTGTFVPATAIRAGFLKVLSMVYSGRQY